MEEECDTKRIKLETELLSSDCDKNSEFSTGAYNSDSLLALDLTKKGQSSTSFSTITMKEDYDTEPIKIKAEPISSDCEEADENFIDPDFPNSFNSSSPIERSSHNSISGLPSAPEFVACRNYEDPDTLLQIKEERIEEDEKDDEDRDNEAFSTDLPPTNECQNASDSTPSSLFQKIMEKINSKPELSCSEENFTGKEISPDSAYPVPTKTPVTYAAMAKKLLKRNECYSAQSSNSASELVQVVIEPDLATNSVVRDKNLSGRAAINETNLTCEECCIKFKNKRALKYHSLRHTDARPFACQTCPARFNLKSHLKAHLLTHFDVKPFFCDVCSARFKWQGALSTHLLTHSSEKRFTCEQCSAGFNRKSQLAAHLLTHSGERPFSCEQCSARFYRRSDLNAHLRTHSNEKPYCCEDCSARFYNERDLKTHLRTHSDERPFTCELCPAKYKSKSNLLRHKRTHTENKSSTSEQGSV